MPADYWDIIFFQLTSLPCGASPASKALQGVKPVVPSLEPCNVHTAGRGEAPERRVREVTVNRCTSGISRSGPVHTYENALIYLSQVQGEVHSSEFFSLRQWWRLPGSSYISVNSGARWVASLTLAGIANVAGACRSAECCFYRISICVPATFSRRLYCSAAQVKRSCETVRRR